MSFNIKNITYEDFKDICRMCMLNCDVKLYQDCIITDIFHKLTDLHFETNDDLPKQICRKCFEKTYEIHEFMLQCKRTHSALIECLKKKQNVHQNETKYEIPIILDKNVINDEFKYIEDISLNSTDKTIKEEVIEDLQETSYNIKGEITIEEHNIEFIKVEHVCDEINNEQNINCSENPLLIPNTGNNQEISNLNDFNENTDSSNCSNTSDPSSGMKKTEDNVYKCDVCSKKFKNFNVFIQHKSLPDCKRAFKCDQCSKSFTKTNHLNRHKLTHSGERLFKCDQCPKSFSESSKMKRHMLAHSGERSFKCDQCSKSFMQLVHLQNHMILHSGERPFKCDQCSKSYTHSSNLYKHRRIHTGESPFKCDQCSKSFNESGTLFNHRRTHTGERPFKCDQCSKSYTHASTLYKHRRTHTGERPFKCDQCLQSFNDSSTLFDHRRTHTGERPIESAP